MNLADLGKRAVQKFPILLVVLCVTAVASTGRTAQKSEPEHKSPPSKPEHSAPANKPTAKKPTSHPTPSHESAPGKPASHSAPAHRPAPSKSASRPAPAEHAGRPAAATGHSPKPRPEHVPAGEHTPTTERTPIGSRDVSLRGGGSASIRSNGQIRSVDHNAMHIDRGLHGERTVESEHNGVRVVNTGRNSGYVQRPYGTFAGHSYYSRTYYFHGSYHSAVYRGYYWHGHAYYGFQPGFWFHPGFYAWGYHPWGAPVFWGIGAWGWGGAPWWGFYGGWFAPYPYYASPAYWLTDYLIASELQSAYAARQEAATDAAMGSYSDAGGTAPSTSASSTVTLSPEVKEAIADEVKVQLAVQEAQAAQGGSGAQVAASASIDPPVQNTGADAQATPTPANSNEEIPPALNPARRTFVVDSNLTVTANGQECGLTGGDVLTRLTDTPDADNMVRASVSASKKSDCAAGLTVSVKVDDLQEMQNHFDEQLDNGMKELAKKQGTSGMPQAPDTSIVESDIPAPKPDTTAEKTLEDQQQAADQTETEVKQEAAAPAPADDQR